MQIFNNSFSAVNTVMKCGGNWN